MKTLFILSQSSVCIAWSAWLYGGGIKEVRNNRWYRICFSYVTVVGLYIIFGIGGLFQGILFVKEYTTEIDGRLAAILASTICALILSILYHRIFVISSGAFNKIVPNIKVDKKGGSSLIALTIAVTAFDWGMRLILSIRGVYFTWASTAFSSSYYQITSSLPYQIWLRLDYLVVVLLSYLYFKKSNSFFKVTIVVHFLLILMRGSRGAILFSVILVAITYIYYQKRSGFLKIRSYFRYTLLTAVLLFGVIFPVISIARYRLQTDLRKFRGNRVEIVQSFVTTYIPNAISSYLTGGYTSSSMGGGSGYLQRFGMYQKTLSKLILRQNEAQNRISREDFSTEIALVIPGAIYPNKPRVESSKVLHSALYGYIPPDQFLDINSTPLTMAYLFGGLTGVLVLISLTAVIFGFVARVVSRIGLHGPLFAIAFMPDVLPLGNSLMSQVVAARDIVILSIIIIALLYVSKRLPV